MHAAFSFTFTKSLSVSSKMPDETNNFISFIVAQNRCRFRGLIDLPSHLMAIPEYPLELTSDQVISDITCSKFLDCTSLVKINWYVRLRKKITQKILGPAQFIHFCICIVTNVRTNPKCTRGGPCVYKYIPLNHCKAQQCILYS